MTDRTAARESARRRDGKFGTQRHAEPPPLANPVRFADAAETWRIADQGRVRDDTGRDVTKQAVDALREETLRRVGDRFVRTLRGKVADRDGDYALVEMFNREVEAERRMIEKAATGTPAKIADRYRDTPIHDRRLISAGEQQVHLGQGVWGRRCPHCTRLFVTSGALVIDAAYMDHLRTDHDVETGPLLPGGTR